MNKERLLILATFLETMVPPEQWDYRFIVGPDWKGAQDLSCGTAGCAIGWAASIPILRRAGMELVGETSNFDPKRWCLDDLLTFANAKKVFNLTHSEAVYLFQPGENEGYSRLPRTATAADVAKHIRRFVKRGGMPGEVVGYAVKMVMVGMPWPTNKVWRGRKADSVDFEHDKPVRMSLEAAEELVSNAPYSKVSKTGRKVVKLVRRRKK